MTFYFSLTVHYIDNDFRRQFEVAGCLSISGSKTGEAIAADIKEALQRVQIRTAKCHLLVRDAAPNMVSGAKLAELPSIDCFIHKLQLAVKDALKDYKLVIKKAKRLPALYNQSSKFRKDFEKTAIGLEIELKVLIQVRLILSLFFKFICLECANALELNFFDV